MSRYILLVTLVAAAACGGDGGTTAPPPPVSVAVSPSSTTANPGSTVEFSANVTNATTTAVTWTASGGSIAGSGSTVTWTAPVAGGSYTVTATSTADPSKSASAAVTVNAVGVTVTPSATSIGAGDTLALAASLTNTANQSVTWSASAGSIIGTGATVQWAAPIAGGSYTVTATSTLDPSRNARATITVTPVQVVVVAERAALFRGEGTTLTASVTGTTGRTVTWTATCGAVTGSGATVQYVAPTTGGPCTVRATSVRDPAQSGAAALTIRSALRVAALDDTNDGACTFEHCSLREALVAANATPARDSIIIVSSAPAASIALGASLPFITAPVDIVGPGASQLSLIGGGNPTTLRSLLYFNGDFTASVRGLTVRGGRRAGGGGVVVDEGADVTLREMQIRDNASVDGPGGGLLALRRGRATLVNVEVLNNRASGTSGAGGGLAIFSGGFISVSGGRIAENEATDAGGGIFSDGAASVLQVGDVTIADNVSAAAAGGLGIRGGTTATITGSTIRANRAPFAGGIEINSASVTVVNSTVIANTVTSSGGGVYVYGTGRWTQQGGSIRENVAGNNGGGGLFAQQEAVITLTDVAVRDNRVSGGGGGGIWSGNNALLTMTGGALSGNTSTTIAGGLFLSGGRPAVLTRVAVDSNTSGQGGGGLFLANNASLTVNEGRIVGNILSGGGGGGIYADNVTLTVIGTTIAANRAVQSGGGLLALNGGTHVLRDVVVEDNTAGGGGGGLGFNGAQTITVERGILRRNTANTIGGGLWKAGQTALTMTGTQVLDNTAGTQGGGLQLAGPGAAATLRRLTVRGNRATTASGGGVTAGVPVLVEESVIANNTTAGIGGGLFTGATGNATIRNSTFSANGAVVGGGIAATGPATVINVTLVANTASDYGGGIGTNNAGAMTVTNLLLSGNLANGIAGDCGRGGTSQILSGGGNLAADATCVTFTLGSDKPNTPAGVSPTLADNGGPTRSHALLAGSAAIDAAVSGACPATDQRGAPRVGTCDIGAVEFGGVPALRAVFRR